MERSPLAPWVDDMPGVSEVMLWISKTLRENEQQGSYGLVVGMEVKSEVFPVVVLGFPDVDSAAINDEGVGLPFYVRQDRMSNCATNLRGCPWAMQPIRDEAAMIPGLSIGGVSCLEDAGSFGGFLTDNGEALHGLTARHCVPRLREGDPVSSPSSLELTARLQKIILYTRYQPEDFLRRAAKDREAEQLLNRYRLVGRSDGVLCRIEGNLRTVMLERVVFENKAGLLAAHNARLIEANEKPFSEIPPDAVSRLDYAIHSVESK